MLAKIGYQKLSKAAPWVTICLSCLVWIAGCGERLEKDLGNDKLSPVSIAISETPPNWLTLIALEKGFFSENGLDVTEHKFPSGKRALNGMFDGKAEIAATADIPVVYRSFERQDFSVFSVIGASKNDNKILASIKQGIYKPEDLRGKHVGIQKAAAAHFFLHLFSLKHGLRDDVRVSGFKVEELVPALINGKVDAISTREPFLSEGINLLGKDGKIFEAPGLYSKLFVFAAHNSYIKKNPQVIRKIIRSMIQAEKFVQENEDQARKILSTRLGLTEAQVSATLIDLELNVYIGQSLLFHLEDEARWLNAEKFDGLKKIPNYLNFIHIDSLAKVKPEVMTLIR